MFTVASDQYRFKRCESRLAVQWDHTPPSRYINQTENLFCRAATAVSRTWMLSRFTRCHGNGRLWDRHHQHRRNAGCSDMSVEKSLNMPLTEAMYAWSLCFVG